MRKSLLSFGIIFSSMLAFAQQDPQFSQYMFAKLPVNAGYAGTSGSICATALYRTQWVGFPGAPKTLFFSIDAPFQILHGGLGLTVMNDQLGNFNFMFIRGAYSYHLPIGATGKLGIGLDAGLIQSSAKNNWLAPDGTDGHNGAVQDNSIPDAGVKKSTFDVGLGLYYRTDQLFVGLSSSHLPQQQLKAKDFDYTNARHYYVMAGYDFFLSSSLTLRPSLIAYSDASVTTFDANVNLLWNNMLWGGVSYRLQDAIIPMVGFAWSPKPNETFKLGYSYDIGMSDLKTYHSNTHEILLNFCIKIPPKTHSQSHINPKFLR